MTNDWIIDVLTDLRKFSATNSMGRLADRLDDTIQVATKELDGARVPSKLGMSDREQAFEPERGCLPGNNA